jgi:hypothetical protein
VVLYCPPAALPPLRCCRCPLAAGSGGVEKARAALVKAQYMSLKVQYCRTCARRA